MNMLTNGWKNKNDSADKSCRCGTWKNHWLNYANKSWPSFCAVYGCVHSPTLGALIYNAVITGEYIVPMCHSCNGLNVTFNLNEGVTPIGANKSEVCE